MDRTLKGRDSKEMLKVLDQKFVDKIDQKIDHNDENEELNRKSKLFETFEQIKLTNQSPAHLKKKISQLNWIRNRESLILDALSNQKNDHEQINTQEVRKSVLNSLDLYEKRRYEDNNSIISPWNFTAPTRKHIDELKNQFLESQFSVNVINQLFDPHYKLNIEGLENIRTVIKSDKFTHNLIDIMFKYITLKFYERNPFTLYKCIELLDTLFNKSKYNYKLYQLDCLLPYLIKTLDDPRYLVRKGLRHNLNQLAEQCDYAKIFDQLMNKLKTKNPDYVLMELLEEIGYLIDKFGLNNFDLTNFHIVFDHIESSIDQVSLTALNVLSMIHSKYGLDSFKDLIDKMNDLTRDKLFNHLDLFIKQTKLLRLNISIFSIDSYVVMDAIKSITGLVKSENKISKLDVYASNFQEIVFDLLDKNKDLSIVATNEILAMMKNKEKKKIVLENVDHIILSCNVRLLDAIREYVSRKKFDRHLFQLVDCIQLVIRSIFECGMGKMLAKGSLKFCLYTLFILQLEPGLNDKGIISVLKSLTDIVLTSSGDTKCLCALIRLMTESYVKNFGEFKNLMIEKIVSCIWERFAVKDKENKNGNVFDIEKIDCIEVLYELNVFLELVPIDTWDEHKNDLQLRMVNTVIHEIALFKGRDIFTDLEQLNIPDDAEIHDFVISVMDWIEENRKYNFNNENCDLETEILEQN